MEMEDDWIFLGDGGAGGSDTDSASDAGSDSDSGFTMIVRRGRKGGDAAGCSVVVSDDAPRVPAVAVPHPTPPGLSFKSVSYAEAFSASSSSKDRGGREPQPRCNDDEATNGEAIVQGAGIDEAAGTASTDDCTVTCKEGYCESDSDQGGEHDGNGSSVEAPSVAAPTVNCPESTTALHGVARSELASGVDQGGAQEVVEDEDSESCEEDADDDTDRDSSSGDEEDTDSSSDLEYTALYSDEEDEDTFSSSDEEYTESLSEEEEDTAEIYSEEDEDEDDDDAESSGEEQEDDEDAESSGEEEEDDGSQSSGELDYVESSGEESHDADNTGEEDDDDSKVSREEQEDDDDDAECSDEVEDAESTGEEARDDDPEISGQDKDDVESSADESDDPESSGKQEESSHVVDVAKNGNQDIFAMLLPKEKASGSNMEMEDYSFDMEDDNAQNGNQDIFAMLLPKEKASGPNMEMEEDIFAMLLPKEKASGPNMEDYSFDMKDDMALNGNQDIFAMLFPKAKACGPNMEDDIADVAQNGNQDIFAMLLPKAKACGGGASMDDYEDESKHSNIDDHEEEEDDGSLFDMLLPRDRAIDDDIDTDSSGMEDNCLESDEEDGIVNVAENGNQEIFDMLLLPGALACDANIHDDVIDSSDGQDESATATAASGYSAGRAARGYCYCHGSRRPEFAGRAARGYDDVDTDSDMEEGDDEVVVAADVNETSPYGLPRPRATTGIQRWGFACRSQAERQALSEDLRRVLQRQLAAEALASSGQPQQQLRSYDDVDDTCDVPSTTTSGGGPPQPGSCTCARTPEAQFMARAVRDTERALATEEARRREAAQLELDRALAREAAAAAEALELALEECATVERQATVDVTRPAVAKRHVQADFTFIIGVYVLVFLAVSLLSLALPSN